MWSKYGCRSWTANVTLIIVFGFALVSAYRPVQHCKQALDNGHYSACAAVTQHYNETTSRSDLLIRYKWFKYESSKAGWHSFALGEEMSGAFMLVMYGDPTASDGAMTVSARSTTGHSPPLQISQIREFDKYQMPEIEVVTSKFEAYSGPLHNEKLNQKPSHVGIAEVFVRGYQAWPSVVISNTSTSQKFLWSSNHKQNMAGDYSVGRNLEAHQMGLGFGFLYIDLLNAATSAPVFGPIDEMAGLKGSSEIGNPPAPTEAELAAGQAYIATVQHASGLPNPPPGAAKAPPADDKGTGSAPDKGQEQSPPTEIPVKTIFGKTLRDWMWHLHGLMLVSSFMFLFPLGTYLLRRPPKTGSGFNSHWTMQAFGVIVSAIGAGIGWFNSYSISITHQYIGIFLLVVLLVQMFLGWRHHVIFVASQSRSWYSIAHVWSGRTILPLGAINILLGMRRREYGWLTMLLVIVAMTLIGGFLIWVIRDTARNKRLDTNTSLRQEVGLGRDEAEEYFQLSNEDDEYSDGEGEGADGGATQRQVERREQAERLAKLDKV